MIFCNSISKLLPIAQIDAGRGMAYWYSTAWNVSLWTMILVAIGLALVVGAIYFRERGDSGKVQRLLLIGLRLVLLGMLLAAMPGWIRLGFETDLPDLILMIDDSQSMGHDDQKSSMSLEAPFSTSNVEASETRYDQVVRFLGKEEGKLLADLSQHYHVKPFWVGKTLRALDVSAEDWMNELSEGAPTQPASELGAGLLDLFQIQRGRPTAAVLLFSDGITTEGPTLSEASATARRLSIPLHLVGVGDNEPLRDQRLTDLLVDDVAFVGDRLVFDVQLSTEGINGEVSLLTLRRSDLSEPLHEERITIDDSQPSRRLQLSHEANEEGDFEFVIDITAVEDESNLENNSLTKRIRVRDETIKVVLVQDAPSYEFRFLKELLGRQLKRGDQTGEKLIELRSVLQSADFRYNEIDQSAFPLFPVQKDELFGFDAIIIGDARLSNNGQASSALTHTEMENIVEFVKSRGGGVVLVAGPQFNPTSYAGTPIEELFPFAIRSAFVPGKSADLEVQTKIRPTALGYKLSSFQLGDSLAESQDIWKQLDGFYWNVAVDRLKPGVMILADAAGDTEDDSPIPMVTLQHIGAGSVVFHAFEESYRWHNAANGDYYARYWIQTLRHLSRRRLLDSEKVAEMTTDRQDYGMGEPVTVRVRFFDPTLLADDLKQVAVMLENDQNQRQEIKLSRSTLDSLIFELRLTDIPPGVYQGWLAAPLIEDDPPSVRFTVRPPFGETDRFRLNMEDMQLAAKRSDGRFYLLSQAGDLVKSLPRGREVNIAARPPIILWNEWWFAVPFALVFVALISTEWILRKKSGML